MLVELLAMVLAYLVVFFLTGNWVLGMIAIFVASIVTRALRPKVDSKTLR